MPLPLSSISVMCNSVSDFLRTSLNAASNNIDITVGAPAEVPDSTDEHRVNLFFYRFEPSSFQAGAYPDDPWRVRMFCMVTIFGIVEDSISAGENELRLIGEIMRVFRHQPISDEVAVNGDVVRLQTIFSPATDEQINQVWSTQGDTTYRPSLIYEMALAPVMPTELRPQPPLVGAFGAETRAIQAARYEGFAGVEHQPVVPAQYVNVANPLWQPLICWVYNNRCQHTLSLDVDDPGFVSFVPQIWLAGDPSESVELFWEAWDSSGWSEITPSVSENPIGTEIDPENIPASSPGVFPIDLALPISLAPGETAAQVLLYAQRSVVTSAGADPILVKSNPLLISLYRVLP
ncbi:hypothetical protein NBRC116494_21650 [Aurantivibrio plasticivorans]